MKVQHILVVEDDKSIARFVELELKFEGFKVTVVHDGREGLMMAQQQAFDVLLLDVMLPGLNGVELCRRIRAVSDVPILLLTARDAVMDRVAGLDAGADDYLVKPFAIEELLARIRSLLRRAKKHAETSAPLQFRDIVIDEEAYSATVGDEKLELTKTEYDLLKYLVASQQRVCTRDQILEHVWGFQTDVETNVVDVYIRHLRAKLPQSEPPYIETVRGVGYTMRD
ncbi:DNA-binding response regulator [Caryophanon tenue]|uniref:DNA-binding response regulator n=1 Tax=Caryophanon tenue TaxID=33978 RepID=A0A1C0YNL6_9BACL|nr:DNA-binding response regulator [Caryophanon tenue]